MPAIHSYQANDIRTGDIAIFNDERQHQGVVLSVKMPNAFDVNIVIDCTSHGDEPVIELHKRSPGALVTAERNPSRRRDTSAANAASAKARSHA